MKKNKVIFAMFVSLIGVLAVIGSAGAQDKVFPASHYIGTLQESLDQIQKLPGIINTAICEDDDAVFTLKMEELAKQIANVNWLMEEMELKTPMDLQIVQTTIVKNKVCGVGRLATGRADLAREKYDKVLRAAGLYTK